MAKKLEMIDLKRRTNMINDRIRQINRSEIYQSPKKESIKHVKDLKYLPVKE
jgi:hypothetical protein